MQTSLTTSRYRITDSNLDVRKRYIDLAEGDIKVLAGLKDWAHKAGPAISHALYDHQFSVPETVSVFTAHAANRGVDMATLRKALEEAQAAYFIQIFDEAAERGKFGVEYFDSRLKIGRRHFVLDLPMKWYIGAYSVYMDVIRRQLQRDFRFRPTLRAKAERAISVVFNYDMQAVADAFLIDLMESIGMDLDGAKIDGNKDVTEYLGEIKRVFAQQINEFAAALADGDLTIDFSPRTEQDVIRRGINDCVNLMRDMVQRVRSGIGVLNETSAQIAEAAYATRSAMGTMQEGSSVQQEAAVEATEGMHQSAEAVESVARSALQLANTAENAASLAAGGGSSVARTVNCMEGLQNRMAASAAAVTALGSKGREVGAIVDTIRSIAEQTNLLALNAAIEAAHAGEHGLGFAVVADEVRALAERSAKSSREIEALIVTMLAEIDQVVRAIADSTREADQSVLQTREAGNALSAIISAADVVSMESQNLTATSEQMAAQVAEVEATVETVAAAARDNDHSVAAMVASASQVDAAAQELIRVAGDLTEMVGRFRIEDSAESRPADKRLRMIG